MAEIVYLAKTKKELTLTSTPRITPLEENIEKFIEKSAKELNKISCNAGYKKKEAIANLFVNDFLYCVYSSPHAFTNALNNGAGFVGVDLNSGCAWVAAKNLWFGSSRNSMSFWPSSISW